MIRFIARPMLASVFILDGVSVLRSPGERAAATAPAVNRIAKNTEKAAPSGPAGEAAADKAAKAQSQPDSTSKNTVRALAAVKIGAGALFAIGKAPRLSATVLAAAHAPTMVARFSDTPGGALSGSDTKFVGLATDAALLGGLFLAAEDTGGKPGLRWRAQAARGEVSAALPTIKGEARSLRSALESTAQSIGSDARNFAGTVGDQSHNASQALSNVTENVGENLPDNAKVWSEKASTAATSLAHKASDAGQNLSERVQNADTGALLDNARTRLSEVDVKGQSERLRANATPLLDSARSSALNLRTEAEHRGRVLRSEAAKRAKEAEKSGKKYRKQAQKRADEAKKRAQKAAKKAGK